MVLCSSCELPDDDGGGDPERYSSYKAVTLSRTDFENSTALINSQPVEKSGKIYVKDNYLIVNEPNKGFHIYDNTNPENPIKIKFLKVLGSTNLSIKGNTIYTNNAIDLITIAIKEDFNSINVTKRVRDVFPELTSPDGYYNNSSSDIVVDWTLKDN